MRVTNILLFVCIISRLSGSITAIIKTCKTSIKLNTSSKNGPSQLVISYACSRLRKNQY